MTDVERTPTDDRESDHHRDKGSRIHSPGCPREYNPRRSQGFQECLFCRSGSGSGGSGRCRDVDGLVDHRGRSRVEKAILVSEETAYGQGDYDEQDDDSQHSRG